METLGFSDSTNLWSDTQVPPSTQTRYTAPVPPQPQVKRGRHEAPPAPTPRNQPLTSITSNPKSDWTTGEVESRFTGGDIRWVRGLAIALIIVGLGIGGYWAYLQMEAATGASTTELRTVAADLDTALAGLSEGSVEARDSSMVEINTLARELFTVAGLLGSSEEALNNAATSASSAALDATRILDEAMSLDRAIEVLAAPPPLETDPEALALDEAIRRFGEWQSGLTAASFNPTLTDLAPTIEAYEALVSDLDGYLSDYAAAMGSDSEADATQVVIEIFDRLTTLQQISNEATEAATTRAGNLLDRARDALASILG